eukprot:2860966-Prymnesium_polylepis.1
MHVAPPPPPGEPPPPSHLASLVEVAEGSDRSSAGRGGGCQSPAGSTADAGAADGGGTAAAEGEVLRRMSV